MQFHILSALSLMLVALTAYTTAVAISSPEDIAERTPYRCVTIGGVTTCGGPLAAKPHDYQPKFQPGRHFSSRRPSPASLPPRTLALEDSTITDMARSWPYLEDLGLEFAFTWIDPPRNTLLGLQALAQYCPYLHTLEMSLNATTVPLKVLVPQPQLLHASVASLDVNHSPIAHPSVARFFFSDRMMKFGVVYSFS
ncbi:hypothetical protein FB451DRAFT_1417488 [Mycena latifolia]|nr:hypothetical protein FB451DRAFT_1417488 [Mycena latifolia]